MFWKKSAPNELRLFVSIGAGVNQLPLITEAKKLGFHVIGVDGNAHAPGMIKCDIRIQESLDHYKEIYVKLQELLLDGVIKGVLSKSYGISIKTACYIANQLNIPYIPHERVDDFINKQRMKSVFKAFDIPSPDYRVITAKTNIDRGPRIAYPGVVKPVVGHAKMGVRLIEGPAELKKVVTSAGKEGDYLLENYVEGDEIIAAGIVHGGRYYLADISDKVQSPLPHFVDLIHISPSKYYSLRERVAEIGQKVAAAFEIGTSPLIMELRITDRGELFLIEAVPEFGGEFIPDVLIPERTGYNFIRETVKAVTGDEFVPPLQKPVKKHTVVKYITAGNGTLMSFNPELPGLVEGMVFKKIFKEIGAQVSYPRTNLDRIGVVAVSARTREEALHGAETAIEGFNIRVASEEVRGKKG